jgi:hypothetical protein
MHKDPSEVIAEITSDVRRLAPPLRDKRWRAILEYLGNARVTIKGTHRDPVYLAKFLGMRSATVQDLEVVVEDLLECRVEAARVELKVRAAAIGRRIEGNAPDGIIMDSRLVFVRSFDRWQVEEVAIDCPPEWAQWNNRPNSRAPIHYGDRAWWDRRASGFVREYGPGD